ncbi:MAG: regulator of sigma protease [Acidobacteriaceae bacterium]|nr:regulator of sigma protease [Acidobacteriaceae bacterium]
MPFVVISILSTLIVLGIMVLVHEFGHFAMAKLFKVKVEVFSIGFGKRLLGFRVGDTDYRLSLLPLGGYVKMRGELGGDGTMPLNAGASGTADTGERVKDPGDLNSKPRWQRVLIALAGPVANFVLALVLMTGLYMMHNEVEAYRSARPATIDFVVNDSPASRAGLQPGDRFVRFDRVTNPSWEEVGVRAEVNMGQTVPVVVQRNGTEVSTAITVATPRNSEDFSAVSLGLVPLMQTTPLQVNSVEPAMPAAKAGLKSGDKILAVDGRSLHSASAVLAYLQANHGAPVKVEVQTGATTRTLDITPQLNTANDGRKVFQLGFLPEPPPYHVAELPLPAAFLASLNFNAKYSSLIVDVLHRMVTRHMAVQNLSGPIGIARQTGLAATSPGWQPIIGTMTIISLNLGIFNLLPIPILDGGVILLLLIESVLRHDLDQKFKERIYQGAFVLLLLFAAFVMINDITKLSQLPKVKP